MMTRHMFTPAAVACLVDGRSPRPDEVDEMAAKIWREAYHRIWKIEWADVEPGTRLHASILAAALAALGALTAFGPDMLNAAFWADRRAHIWAGMRSFVARFG